MSTAHYTERARTKFRLRAITLASYCIIVLYLAYCASVYLGYAPLLNGIGDSSLFYFGVALLVLAVLSMAATIALNTHYPMGFPNARDYDSRPLWLQLAEYCLMFALIGAIFAIWKG